MEVLYFQKMPDYMEGGSRTAPNLPFHHSSTNISYSFAVLNGFTLTAPMQFWQQASNKPILSLGLIL